MKSQNHDNAPSTLQSLKSFISVIASVAGIVIMLYGFKLCIDIFMLIYGALTEPQQIASVLNQWAQTDALKSLTFNLGERTFSLSHVFAIIIGCGCALLLGWLAIAMMQTGARIISWTSNEEEAIKKILKSAFGPSMKPVIMRQSDKADSKSNKSGNKK